MESLISIMPPLSSLSTIDEAREWSDLEAPPAEREDYHSNDLPRKPVLKRDGFCVEDFQFSYLFRPRYQESDLRPCLFPYHQRIGPERRKALMMEDGALRTPHIVAQLKHYAIEFDPEAPKSELKELLRRSFEKGKVRDTILTDKDHRLFARCTSQNANIHHSSGRFQTPSHSCRFPWSRNMTLYTTNGKPT